MIHRVVVIVLSQQIMALHGKVWDDGYVMFPAPWPGYNNMNVVIAKRTPDVEAWCKANSVTKGVVPEFSKTIRKLMISAEVCDMMPTRYST